ncbi:MAG: hypothetical protein WCK86_07180 [Planctomycetia bacterium]|jgi:hypothetical protein
MNQVFEDVKRFQLWFPFFQVLIAAVAFYDSYLTMRFRDVMLYTEENPLGRWLIQSCDGSVAVFLQMKLAGTLLVMLMLFWMRVRQSRMTLPVSGSIASWQCGLLVYLTAA